MAAAVVACRSACPTAQTLRAGTTNRLSRRTGGMRHPAPPRAATPAQDGGSSLPDSLAFTAADAAFLRAMAMRPSLPSQNIGWDDGVGDHSCIDGWHAQAWQMWGQAKQQEEPTRNNAAQE